MFKANKRLLPTLLLISLPFLPACEREEAATTGAPSTRGASGAIGTEGGSEVMAHVDGEPITVAQVEEVAGARLTKIEQDRYDALRNVLEGIISQKLVEREAAARELTVDELIQSEIQARVVPPSEDELRKYYEANKSRAQGKTFDQLRADIETGMIRSQTRNHQTQFLQSLRSKADVTLALEPPRFNVEPAPGDKARGPETAPITIVEFADFECPYCRRAHPALERVLDEFSDSIRFVFRDFPLSNHQRAIPASEAARCADDQGKFWEYYENLMAQPGDLSDADLKARADSLGLDANQFGTCFSSRQHTGVVRAAFESGQNLGVTGTPAFFVNGRFVSGLKSYEDWKSIIDEELAFASGAGS